MQRSLTMPPSGGQLSCISSGSTTRRRTTSGTLWLHPRNSMSTLPSTLLAVPADKFDIIWFVLHLPEKRFELCLLLGLFRGDEFKKCIPKFYQSRHAWVVGFVLELTNTLDRQPKFFCNRRLCDLVSATKVSPLQGRKKKIYLALGFHRRERRGVCVARMRPPTPPIDCTSCRDAP